MDSKLCRSCNTIKLLSEFTNTTFTKSGKTSNCSLCRNAYSKKRRELNYAVVRATERNSQRKNRLLSVYGITAQDYQDMLHNQDYSCNICCTHVSELKRALSVDHDHATGKVRGLLCSKCNVGLGHFNDSLELLSSAYNYLEKHSA